MYNFSLWSRSVFLRRAAWQQQMKPFPVLSWPVIKRLPVSEATFDKLSLVGPQSISPVSPGCRTWWLWLGIFLACFPKGKTCARTLCQPLSEMEPIHPALKRRNSLKAGKATGGNPKKIKPVTWKFKEAKRKAGEIRPDEAGCNPSVSTMETLACFRAKITMSKKGEFFWPLKFRFFHFVSANTRSKWAFVRSYFFSFQIRKV